MHSPLANGSNGFIGESPDAPPTAYISYDEKPGIQAIGATAADRPPVPGQYTTVGRDRATASALTLCRFENRADAATAWRVHTEGLCGPRRAIADRSHF